MTHTEYYEEEVFEEDYREEEDRDERCDYERHPLDSSYYEDARFM